MAAGLLSTLIEAPEELASAGNSVPADFAALCANDDVSP
jgi:hypothetical protein